MKRVASKKFVSRVAPALALLAAPLVAIEQAHAQAVGTCTPPTSAAAPVNNTAVTCTGGTITQNGANGYGTGTETGDTITVDASATVTGTLEGIVVSDGTVTNNGGIIKGTDNVSGGIGFHTFNPANAVNNNSGTIQGGFS